MLNRNEIESYIRREWQTIFTRSKVKIPPHLGWLPRGHLHPLGSSIKTEKGEDEGILTGISYLMPGSSSGMNLCPMSTKSCRAGCLGENAGRMRFDDGVKNAQAWKTIVRLGAREHYMDLVRHDIVGLMRRARRDSMHPAVRLDGTSDLGDQFILAEEFPEVTFYDYTKVPDRINRWMRSGLLNQDFTFSYSGENILECMMFLGLGVNVAVPFDVKKGDPLPREWMGHPVYDGDVSDWRPGDPKGHVIGLRWKGGPKNRQLAIDSGWLQPMYPSTRYVDDAMIRLGSRL